MQIAKSTFLQQFLAKRTEYGTPDRRPLYAYKCQQDEYRQIKDLVSSTFDLLRGKWPTHSKVLFCLYAAETWRKCHTGGPWKWETVFQEINQSVPSHAWLRETVGDGLSWWGRPLLKSQIGHREFLVTIACEGGLPLRLLLKENASLYNYFRQLLTVYHQERKFSTIDDAQLAGRLSHLLPTSLRHDIVFSLSGKLISEVVNLQEKVKDASDPIHALDELNADWRSLLPLPIQDDTIERLLNNLVKEARTLAITERQQIRWRRFLRQSGDDWKVEQILELPNIISGPHLQQWLNTKEIPTRLRLFLYKSEIPDQIAILTLLRGEGVSAVYRCELLTNKEVKLSGDEILTGTNLCLSDGTNNHFFKVQGGQEWGPLPWFFKSIQGEMEFLGEGHAKCREQKMYMLSPPGGDITGNGNTRTIGHSFCVDRIITELSGDGDWQHPELGICHYHCSSKEENSETFEVEGVRLRQTMESLPPFRGLPHLVAVHRNGDRRKLNDVQVEWRPAGITGLKWRKSTQDCGGVIWIRYQDKDGTQLLLRKIRVVPPEFRIEFQKIGNDKEAGIISLFHIGLCRVAIKQISGTEISVEEGQDYVDIVCQSSPGPPVAMLTGSLSWLEGCAMPIDLPIPSEGAAFVRSGNSIPPGGRVAVSRLAAVHAVLQAPIGINSFHLNAKIMLPGDHLSIDDKIPLDDKGRGIFELHHLQERLSNMLALTGDLDATADLSIRDSLDSPLANLEVGLFELLFEPDYEGKTLSLPLNCMEQLEPDWDEHIKVKMMKLWDPEAEAQKLHRRGAAISWEIPEGLDPGPWLIVGEDGDWPRFRPVMWHIDGEVEPEESPLVRAITERSSAQRNILFTECTRNLAIEPEHPDWLIFTAYLKLLHKYPAPTFELFQHLIREPEAMVVALLKSNDSDFDTVWSLADQLPFSWYLVPICAWHSASSRYFMSLRKALSTIEQGEELVWDSFQKFQDRVKNHRPFFKQICDWLSQSLFPERELNNSELAMAKQAPQIISGFIKDEELKLQERHGADERYPDGPQVMKWQHHPDFPADFRYKHLSRPYRPVRCAPFAAAFISLRGEPYDKSILFELQRLRSFDAEWFGASFAFALCLNLAQYDPMTTGEQPE